MHDSKHRDVSLQYDIVDNVWKPPKRRLPNVISGNWVLLGVIFDGLKSRSDRARKLVPETGTALLVPVECLR